MHWPWRAAMFKTLYRNDGTYRKPGVHRPRSPDPARLTRVRWFDGSGRELGHDFHTKRLFSNYGQPNYDLVQLNHYPLGAMESFVVKADRGRAVHAGQRLDVDYWVERNFNTDTDTSIAAVAPLSAPIRAGLQADPVLAELHAAAVAWRKARFLALVEQEPWRALLARLMMTPPSRPISPAAARMLTGYALKGRLSSEAEE